MSEKTEETAMLKHSIAKYLQNVKTLLHSGLVYIGLGQERWLR